MALALNNLKRVDMPLSKETNQPTKPASETSIVYFPKYFTYDFPSIIVELHHVVAKYLLAQSHQKNKK